MSYYYTTRNRPPFETVETYEGWRIYLDEYGYYWQEGGDFETVEDCREDIDHWNSQER